MVLPVPLTVAAALAAGESPKALQRRARSGELVPIARGWYAPAGAWEAASPEDRLRLRIEAAASTWRSVPPVFSHESAAVLLGIPLIGPLPDAPHVTVAPGGACSTPAIQRTRRSLSNEDIVEVEGFVVTSPLRTALDLAATRSLLAGAVAFSHVQRFNGIPAASIADVIDAERPFRGAAKASRALARSTSGSDSALETLVVVRCQDLGFAPPEQQFLVRLPEQDALVDFAWLGGRILAEADGKGKYTDPALLGDRTSAEVVYREKLREDALRQHSDAFTRITWPDAWNGEGLARKLTLAGVPRPGRPGPLTR